MGSRSHVAHEADLPTGTLAELFLETVDRFSGTDAAAFCRFVGDGGQLEEIGYREALARVRAAAAGLSALGLERGDRAAIISENRPEWAFADYACLCAGVVDVPVYDTLLADQVAYILQDSGARVVFVAGEEGLATAVEARAQCDHEIEIVVFEEGVELPAGARSWSDLLASGREGPGRTTEAAFREEALRAAPEDVATLIYTSGTTGRPKGVMLTHLNLFSNVAACSRMLAVRPDDVTLSFLPLSHVLQRMVDYLLFAAGCTICYARDIQNVAEDLKVVRPTVVVSVPRLYEKVYNRVMEASGVRGKLVGWARSVAERWADRTLAGDSPSLALQLQHSVADALVFKKIRAGVGGRLRFFVSGGAPLEPGINRFFYGAGLTILEGYGLTETSPVTNVNTVEDFRLGTVGKPVPGTEIRIADDGEILVRGPQVMKGYYGRPDATAEAIDADGWFHTGDVGELDADGFLRITDRKKDLIVTAGGKNVAPQPIENRLKTNPYVEQAVMVGDRRKFVALLVVPDFSQLEGWARREGLRWSSRVELLERREVQEMVQDQVADALGELARYETPKKIALLHREFTIEDGTLTPTQKVKRRVIQERYSTLIDRFYDEAAQDRSVFVEPST